MREIPLSRGLVALVDDDDYEWLSRWKWYAQRGRNTFYAARNRRLSDCPGPAIIFMHREIAGSDGPQVDHVSGDGLDNRRSNLRPVTATENALGARKRQSKSGVRGVYRTRVGRWAASFGLGWRSVHIGTFDDPAEAAAARRDFLLGMGLPG
jgi:hypothetical protein